MIGGATLEQATAGVYPASTHSVSFTERQRENLSERISLVFKLRASLGGVIDCAELAANGCRAASIAPFCFPMPVEQFIQSFEANYRTVNPTAATAGAAGVSGAGTPSQPPPPAVAVAPWSSPLIDRALERAGQLRERGNTAVQAKDFDKALRCYRASLHACPRGLRTLQQYRCPEASSSCLVDIKGIGGETGSILEYFVSGGTRWDRTVGFQLIGVKGLDADNVKFEIVIRDRHSVLLDVVNGNTRSSSSSRGSQAGKYTFRGSQQEAFMQHAAKVQSNRALCYIRLGHFRHAEVQAYHKNMEIIW